MIAKQPSKARHEGKHLAIFAHFRIKWAQAMLDILSLSLVMHYLQVLNHPITCMPIPKGTKWDPSGVIDTHPLSLVEDGFGFLSAKVEGHMAKRLEDCQLLLSETVAY
jgi:hypothetical protein